MKKQMFILEVNDSQNQSWQGNIEWVQGQKKQSFRSVMEMLRLVDSAICGKREKADLVKKEMTEENNSVNEENFASDAWTKMQEKGGQV